MSWTHQSQVIAGYNSGEITFGTLFSRQNQQTQNALFDKVVEPAVQSEKNAAANQFAAIAIFAHSDRVDTAGLTAEQRRAQELKASQDRARDAAKWVFDQICELLLAAGATVPDTPDDAQNFSILRAECGAADLVHTVPANEAQRKDNRRIDFEIALFTP